MQLLELLEQSINKIMKKYILFFLLTLSLSVCAESLQKGRPDFKQIVEKRFDVIAHELDLDKNKFNALKPIYMEYCRKLGGLFKFSPEKFKNRDQRTDEEIEQDFKADFTRARKMVDIRETYYNKFRKYLTPRQIEKIYDIERREQRMFHKHRK